MLKAIVIIPTLFVSPAIHAQRPATGAWLSLQLPVQLSPKWQIHNDINYRTLGNSVSALQHLHRFGIRYALNQKWAAAVGGAFSFTRTSFTKQNDEFSKEFRCWQEVTYKTVTAKKTQWQIRVRTEERSFSATDSKAAFHAFRYRIKTQLLQKFSDKWALFLANEYMQQYAHNARSFDQNRFILSGIYYFDKPTQLQAGYMWLRWPAHSSQHILTLSFIKDISLDAKR
jgi:hypothetical protein